MADEAGVLPLYPLARTQQDKGIARLPDGADGFLVHRVPSRLGGRPGVVPHPSDASAPLCIELDTTQRQLGELVGSGRFRLDVIDSDGKVIKGGDGKPALSCWTKIDTLDEAIRSGPAPTTAAESSLVRINERQQATIEALAHSVCEVMTAFASRIRDRPPSEVYLPEDRDEQPAQIAAGSGTGERPMLDQVADAAPKIVAALMPLAGAMGALNKDAKPPARDVTPKAAGAHS